MQPPRLYVARDARVLVVSRQHLRTAGGRTAHRRWPGVLETSSATPDPEPPHSWKGAMAVGLPPLVSIAALPLLGVPIAASVGVGFLVFFGSAYLTPLFRRRSARRAAEATTPALTSVSDTARLLFDADERASFERALAAADRISDTWPELAGLVDPADAEPMLGAALWDLSGLLVRRQEVRRVLAGLDRPEYVDLPPGDAARDLEAHRSEAAALLAGIDADIARREASLTAAETAGRDFVRERDARLAVAEAARALRGLTAEPAALPDPSEDGAAELAERTETVLAAYRELTAG
jgi:hypothetical protein